MEKRELKLNPTEKQIILYAKNHFQGIDYENELPYFAARMYGFEVKDVSLRNTLSMVTDLYLRLVEAGIIQFKFENFINDLFRRSKRERDDDNVSKMDVVREMMAEIQGMPVKDLELGNPDFSIFKERIKKTLNK